MKISFEDARVLVNAQLNIFSASGIRERSGLDIITVCILLSYLNNKTPELTTDIAIKEDLVRLKDSNEISEDLANIFKKYINLIPGFPSEILGLDISDINRVQNKSFFRILNEWNDFVDRNQVIWSYEEILLLFDALETPVENSYGSDSPFMTPKDVVKLITSSLLINDNAKNIYDPFARTGEFISEIGSLLNNGIKIVASSLHNASLITAKLKMFMLQTSDVKWIRPINNTFIPDVSEKFDYIITNPPFGIKTNKRTGGEWTTEFNNGRSEIDFLCHILDHLSEAGNAAILVPDGILSSGGKVESLRKKMIEEGILEAAISLPPKMFYNTGVKAAILFLNKTKFNDRILLMDATSLGSKSKLKHNFSEADISSIVYIVDQFRTNTKSTDSISSVVSLNQLKENNYDLQCASYLTESIYPEKTNSIASLLNECNELEIAIKNVQANIARLLK
ncbi:N-6 DNA methylase [Pedobacter cryoconitis]|uniref:site-specific DNA-methyltransferase (adenine-specific) n=1 Tax=Pedobacter cryoconitis TaxID=188932 RepID=A0A7X0MJ22_9SPHI|nr:N-6 DNA methylase [Pedobacter cryoconitis]MBB6499008.1 type I restriction-modification system DNA methylase subunit [Pedobacter cryoconitis]